MTAPVLHLTDALAAQILTAAARCFPREACGLIEGEETLEGWRALAIHEADNLAADATRRFLIDPAVQFRLLKALRGGNRRVIGCFHSHPGGAAEPSGHDRASALEADFLWLIAGGDPETGFTLRGFVFSGPDGFRPIVLSEGV
jgi:desampylase